MALIVALVLGLMSAFALPAPNTAYVAPDGDDARDCQSPATACASFDAGYRAAAPGDVVEVAEGSYPPQVFTEDASKTSELDVLVRPAPGARVVVGCAGPDNCLATGGADHLTVEGVATAYLEPVAGMRRQGGVALDRGSQDVTFRSVDAGHLWFAAGDSAVLGGDYGPTVDEDSKIAGGDGSNQLIDGAVFHDHLLNAEHMQCIWLAGANGVTIRRSRFDTCAVFSIFSTPEAGQVYRDVLIENNVFSNSGGVSMSTHVKVGSHGGECVNFVIRNNTFVDENVISDCGIEQGTATNVRWIGNIFSEWNTGGSCALGGHVFDYNVIEDGAGCGPHDRVVGPGNAGFVDRAALDLRLRADSPAIDRGSPDEFPAVDIDGNLRPRGSTPDAGAHEWGSTGDVAPDESGSAGDVGPIELGSTGDVGPDVVRSTGDVGPGAGARLDRVAPALRVRVGRRMRLRGRRLAYRVTCSQPCRLTAALWAAPKTVRRLGLGRRARSVGRGQSRLLVAGPRRIVVRIGPKAYRAMPRAGSVRLTLHTAASGSAGNARTVTRRLTLRR